MRKPLKSNTILKGKYIISGVLSVKGSSSLIYKAHVLSEDGEVQTMNPVIIKEFYPKEWSDKGYLERSSNEMLCDTEYRDAFCKELECFKEQSVINNVCGYDEGSDTRFIASSYMECFLENQTGYIVSTSFNGITLSQYSKKTGIPKDKKSFIQTVKLIESMAYAVKEQHRSGYLNLDVTPDNLLLSQTGNGYTISVIDYGSCLPLCESYTKDDIELVARRVTHSGEYSSKNVKSLYKDKRHFLLADDDSKYDWYEEAINQVSPADDIYSIGVTFFEMLTNDRKIGNYYKALASINYLNAAEKDWLLHVFQQIVEMRYENIEQFLYDLDYLENTLTRIRLSKHAVWSSSLNHYRKHNNESAFKHYYVPVLNKDMPEIKLNVKAKVDGIKCNEKELEKIISVLDAGNYNYFIQGLGGSGKTYAAANLYKKHLDIGDKVPIYYDLGRLAYTTVDSELEFLEKIFSDYLDYQKSEDNVNSLENFLKKNKGKKAFLIILDNFHKIENEKLFTYINAIEKAYKCVQLITMGRVNYREMLEVPRDLFTIVVSIEGIDKVEYFRQINYIVNNSYNENWLFEEELMLPLFFMKYLELLSIGAIKPNMKLTEESLLHQYFEGILGRYSILDYKTAPIIRDLIEAKLPEYAFAFSCTKSSFDLDLRKYMNNEQIGMAVNELAVLESSTIDWAYFTHDIYLNYFCARYIANNLKNIRCEQNLFLALGSAKDINYLWSYGCIDVVRKILNQENIFENTTKNVKFFIKRCIEETTLVQMADYYKLLPANYIELLGLKARVLRIRNDELAFDDSIISEDINELLYYGCELNDGNSYNKKGIVLCMKGDLENAIECFIKSYEKGCENARYNLKQLRMLGIDFSKVGVNERTIDNIIGEESESADVKFLELKSTDGTVRKVEEVISFELNNIGKKYIVYRDSDEQDGSGDITISVSEVIVNSDGAKLVGVKDEDWPAVFNAIKQLAKA